jgi:hypothetical protein
MVTTVSKKHPAAIHRMEAILLIDGGSKFLITFKTAYQNAWSHNPDQHAYVKRLMYPTKSDILY